MAFESTANQPGRLGLQPRQDVDGRWDVLVPIGYDPDVPLTYYFSVHTYPREGTHEFGFALAWSFNNTGIDDFTYECDLVRKIVPKETRILMSTFLEHYTFLILQHARHSSFFMETFTPNLLPGALTKYDTLNELFRRAGYTVSSAATTPGKHKWVMARE